MQLTLYYAPTACSLVSYVTLTEAGAKFSVRPLNFARRDHHDAEFLKINPRHRVPVLLIDDEPLLETLAIQLWVARQYPAARLLPEDPMQQLQAIARMAWCASGIHPCLTPNALPERYCDLPGSEESVRRCARKLLLENYQIGEQLLTGRSWFFDHFTAVDAYFFWCFRRGQQFGVDVSAFRHCLSHFERMSERASVRQVLSYEAQVLEEFRRSA
jgi:glutathione S-transferase